MEDINIVSITDNNGIIPLKACINSIIKNMSDSNLKLYIICDNKNFVTESLSNILTIRPNLKIIIIEPDNLIRKKASIIANLTKNYDNSRLYLKSIWNFMRFFIHELINEVKCIYLDTDTIVENNFSEVYLKFDKKYDAGVVYKERLLLKDWIKNEKIQKIFIKIHNREILFNAGVVILNLENIRKINVFKKLKKILIDSKYLNGGTQSVQNLLYDSCMALPHGMNYVPGSLIHDEKIYIYHYAGNIKPWVNEKKLEERINYKYDLWEKYSQYIS